MIDYFDLIDNQYLEEELKIYINDFNEEHWTIISRNQVLSESFIERYKDKVDWEEISEFQKLSENFILNNLDLIDIDYLEENENIPKETIEKVRFMKELQSCLLLMV
jgi:hypothetical protein